MSIRLNMSFNTGALYQLCISLSSSISYTNSEHLWLNSHAASCAMFASLRYLCTVSYVVSSMVSLVCVVLRDVAV